MKDLKDMINFLFNHKKIDSKQWVEQSMTKKYGKDWLNKCLEGLRDKEVRKSLTKTLDLSTSQG